MGVQHDCQGLSLYHLRLRHVHEHQLTAEDMQVVRIAAIYHMVDSICGCCHCRHNVVFDTLPSTAIALIRFGVLVRWVPSWRSC